MTSNVPLTTILNNTEKQELKKEQTKKSHTQNYTTHQQYIRLRACAGAMPLGRERQ